MGEKNFFRKPTKKEAVGIAGAVALGVAAGDMKPRDASPSAPSVEHVAKDSHRRDSGNSTHEFVRPQEQGADDEDLQGLEGEELERARENARYRREVADLLRNQLEGTGWQIGWTVERDGKRVYEDDITISDASGAPIGSVFPDESGGEMVFRVNEGLEAWIGMVGETPATMNAFTDPSELKAIMEEAANMNDLMQQERAAAQASSDFGEMSESIAEIREEARKELVENEYVTTKEIEEARKAQAEGSGDTG